MDEINVKIQDLRENRAEMIHQTNEANADASKLQTELEKYREELRTKMAEKERIEKEKDMAVRAFNDTKKLIARERRDFLERCQEFRTSCKKIRTAASILVLDGEGGNFDLRHSVDEMDLWRKLEDENLSDAHDVEKDEGEVNSSAGKRGHKQVDTELICAEKEEKESRQNHIEAECLLHTTRCEHETATAKCNSRRMKLTQQRAQLERHRREVKELEKDIDRLKDEVVEANQMASTFETEFQRRKQISQTNAQASHSNNLISSSRDTNISNPYRRMPQITNNVPISNPYKRSITPNVPHNHTNNNSQQPRSANRGCSSHHRYASDLLNEVTPRQQGNNTHPSQSNNTRLRSNQRQKGGSRTSRHNRQFGTNVGVSVDSEMTDELRECMAAFATDGMDRNVPDDLSVSSSSSSDDEILSFNIFGKK